MFLSNTFHIALTSHDRLHFETDDWTLQLGNLTLEAFFVSRNPQSRNILLEKRAELSVHLTSSEGFLKYHRKITINNVKSSK